MPVFDELQRAGFDGIEFPVSSVSIRGRFRKDDHEYLRVPGAVIEKQARGLYMIEMEALFDVNVKGYGVLWPDALTVIRQKYERGVTGPLTIPSIGTIPAMIPEWDQRLNLAHHRSGEKVPLKFSEDRTEEFLALAAQQVAQTNLEKSASNLAEVMASLRVSDADLSLFLKIQNAANAVFSVKDRVDLYGGLLTAKVEQLTSILRTADQALESIKDPLNHQLLQALLDLWDSAVTLTSNLAESPRGARNYTTPRTMSVSDVSAALYGNTSQANTILLNNNLVDPFAIPAGTSIIYFV